MSLRSAGLFSLFPTLVLVTALFPSAPVAPVQGTTHRLLNRLESAFPHSIAGPMATTRDGGTLFVAEAGVLAVIDADQPSSYTSAKLAKIASHGVRAVEMALDPQADPDELPDDRKTVIYVAGGRQGAWLMQADPRANQPMAAARIDDADNATDPTEQKSQRWCTDVDTFTHGGTQYLVALFARWGCNHVRVYPLDAARAVLADHPGEETGNELAAALEVKFGGNCLAPTPRHESYALGLAVDDSDPNETYVFVAAGPYGLVRIRFPDPTDITVRQVTDGPWFGNGSYYANSIQGGPYGGLYNHFEVRGRDPTNPIVLRKHAPAFCDVAIQYAGANTYLWCAVDAIGILRFDITNPSSWSTSSPIDHQEGLKKTAADFPIDPTDPNPQPDLRVDDHVRLVAESSDPTLGEPATVEVRNYAHRIRIANGAGPPALAVAVRKDHFFFSDSILNEGRLLDHIGHQTHGTVWGMPGHRTAGHSDYTLLYDLDALVPKRPADTTTTPAYQHVALLRQGGRHVHLPEQHPQGGLLVFGGLFDSGRFEFAVDDVVPSYADENGTFRASYDWPAGTLNAALLQRLRNDRPGRLVYDMSFSASNPRLFYFGGNDAHVVSDGRFLAVCGGEIVPIGLAGPIGLDTFGILFNPFAVWPTGTGHDLVWGVSKVPTYGVLWTLTQMNPGSDLCDPTLAVLPERVKRIFIQAPFDNFLARGRGYFSGGEMSLSYDGWVSPNAALIFGSRFGTPAGIVVLNRATLQNSITVEPEGTVLDETVATFRELLTHPEFRNVYYDPNPPPRWLGPTTPQNPNGTNLVSRVNTSFPRLLQAKAPSGSPFAKHWTLAVPCAAVQLPEDLPTFTDPSHPEYLPPPHPWLPDPEFVTNYDHSMVRVFDVNDWGVTTDDTDPTVAPADYTLIGPRPQTAAIRIEPLTWNDRDYLFVTDYGGSLQVWDVTDLLEQPAGRIVKPGDADYGSFLVQEWLAPLSISDDFTNNVWSVVVDPATWVDAAGQHDEVYAYVLVGRVGIEALRFVPSAPAGQRLEWLERVEVPYDQGALRIWTSPSDATVRRLLVAHSLAGFRMFGYGDQ